MAYIVISEFVDLDDRHHFYHEGDEYPRKGYTPSEDRVNALLSGKNSMGVPFIRHDADGGNDAFEGAIPAPAIAEAEIDAAPEPKRRGRPRKSE